MSSGVWRLLTYSERVREVFLDEGMTLTDALKTENEILKKLTQVKLCMLDMDKRKQ